MKHYWKVLLASTTLLSCLFSCTSEPAPAPSEMAQLKDSIHISKDPAGFQQLFEIKKNKAGIIPRISPMKWANDDAQLEADYLATYSTKQLNTAKNQNTANSIGPFGISGRTRAVLADKASPKHFLAGGVSGGLWTSTDAGDSWSPVDDQAASLAVTCLAQDPFNTSEIIYGTGEFASATNPLNTGVGLMKSVDGGQTFSSITSTDNNSDFSSCFTVAYSNSLATAGRIYAGTTKGLLVSDNEGATWTKYLAGERVFDVISFTNGAVLIATEDDIYYSPDETLSSLQAMNNSINTGRIEIANCLAQENLVYAVLTTSSIQAVLKSTDFGQTWNAVVNPGGLTYGRYTLAIAVHPTDPDQVILGGVKMKYSADGGQTWNLISDSHDDYHAYDLIPNTTRFLIGNDGGVYEYDWNSVLSTNKNLNNGYNTVQFYFGDYFPSGQAAIGGTQDNGTWYMNGTGNPSEKINIGDGMQCYVSKTTSDFGFTSRQFGTVTRKTNLTTEFFNSDCVTSTTMTDCFTAKLADNPNYGTAGEISSFQTYFRVRESNEDQLFMTTAYGIWLFEWTGVLPGYQAHKITNTIYTINTLEIEDSSNPSLYYGGFNKLGRIDNALTATGTDGVDLTVNRPSELLNSFLNDIDIHPSDPSKIYVCFASNGEYSKIYEVSNATTTDPIASPELWNDISGNFPDDLPVNCLALHPDAPETVLYIGTDYGLYFTEDGGDHWLKEESIPNVPIFDLELRESDLNLFVFTHGRGAFTMHLSSAGAGFVAGNIRTETGGNVAQVEVTADNQTVTTGLDGNYSIGGLSFGQSIDITPAKDINDLNGVTILDLQALHVHILNTQPFTSPYHFVAADLNNSGTVTTVDKLLLKKRLLLIDDAFEFVPSWKFVPANFQFPNTTNPIANGYPEVLSLNFSQSYQNQDFIGVKMGDFNGNVDPSMRKATGEKVVLKLEDQRLQAGEVLEIPVRVEAFQRKSGYQLSLKIDAEYLELISIETPALTSELEQAAVVLNNDGRSIGFTASLEGASLENNATLVTLQVRVKQSAPTLRDKIYLSQKVDENAVFDTQQRLGRFELELEGTLASVVQAPFPNPFQTQFQLVIATPTTGQVSLELFDLNGKRVLQQQFLTNEGKNSLTVNQLQGIPAGTYFYALKNQAGETVKEGKLVKDR